MKLVVIIFVTVIALATAASFQNDNVRRTRLTALELKDAVTEVSNRTRTPIQGRGAILSENGKNMVENFINHLPCGWPKAGIPPLAPYAKKEIDFKVKKSFVELSQKLEYFRIDGLDIVLIERLKVGYIFKTYVKFNLTFPKIIISGKYLTAILIDAMKEYGISVKYDGRGDFELMLENLNFIGSFNYDMPLLLGNTKIYKFHISVSMGNVVSQIRGIGGNGKLNRLLNDKIEEIALHVFNSSEMSENLDEVLVPFINGKLEGRNMWTFIKSLFGQKGKICYPPPYPW